MAKYILNSKWRIHSWNKLMAPRDWPTLISYLYVKRTKYTLFECSRGCEWAYLPHETQRLAESKLLPHLMCVPNFMSLRVSPAPHKQIPVHKKTNLLTYPFHAMLCLRVIWHVGVLRFPLWSNVCVVPGLTLSRAATTGHHWVALWLRVHIGM